MRGRVFVDVEKCLSCKRCRIACAVEHSKSGNLYEAMFEDPPARPRIQLTLVKGATVPVACRHCEAAPCMMVCPSGAINRCRAEDPVVIDSEACVGCRSCVVVCPYGVPEMNQMRSTVAKCDLCIERQDAGQVPACVEACMPGALTFQPEPESDDEPAKTPRWATRPALD